MGNSVTLIFQVRKLRLRDVYLFQEYTYPKGQHKYFLSYIAFSILQVSLLKFSVLACLWTVYKCVKINEDHPHENKRRLSGQSLLVLQPPPLAFVRDSVIVSRVVKLYTKKKKSEGSRYFLIGHC